MRGNALGIIAAMMCAVSMSGCQGAVKSMGGSMILELPAGVKLEEITWKDDSLWYLTRPMREGEEAETHTFQQSSEFGVFEGTVTLVETKEDEDAE